MFERSISDKDVECTIHDGKTIVSYPDDRPYPSQLMLGWNGDRPIHVVVAWNEATREHIVITAYEPEASVWGEQFETRRQQ
jgi:hypothetical protein